MFLEDNNCVEKNHAVDNCVEKNRRSASARRKGGIEREEHRAEPHVVYKRPLYRRRSTPSTNCPPRTPTALHSGEGTTNRATDRATHTARYD